MEFENEQADEAYHTIVNSTGVGLHELASSPDKYIDALDEHEFLEPGEVHEEIHGLEALKLLEEAGLVEEEGNKKYTVRVETQVYEEVFNKLEDRREYIF